MSHLQSTTQAVPRAEREDTSHLSTNLSAAEASAFLEMCGLSGTGHGLWGRVCSPHSPDPRCFSLWCFPLLGFTDKPNAVQYCDKMGQQYVQLDQLT